ncbi:hypothetical protein VSDG_07639 [Cytospora chrysosperma]|uniref:Rhodopsin domain-containing protein n=1 Tax=Cytospora chrysosperma TaxID=252740 RepID=A0A423VLV0_CYTCH|nr:hypothetical protein VSDG_07639 [Valsa sordida]
MNVAFIVIGNYSAMLGFGRDTWYVNPNDLTFALKLFYISESLYLTLLGLTKVSVIFFYLRIFPNPRFRVFCWVVMCWVLVSTTTFVILQIFQCTPISAIWRSWEGNYPMPYHCFDVNALVYAAAGFSIAQDIVILAMPLPLLLSLNTKWRRKFGIVIMFSLGVFVLATSCIRLRFMVLFARTTNPAWDYSDVLVWSGVEVAVSIIVTSLPAIRILLIAMWPKAFSTGVRKSSGRPSGASGQSENPPLGGENVVDHGGGLEDAGSRAEMHSPIPDFWAAKTPPMEQFPQYYREDARKPPVRDTIISGTSGITGSSGTTAGSGTPMLPSIPRSAFDEDTPKPKKKLLLCGIKRSNFYVLLVLLLFILVAGVAIGVGVGMSTTSGASPYSKQTNPSRRALYNPRDRRRHE